VPIVAGDELLGVMNVNFPTGAVPTADEQEAIDLFASQAAVAIRNASLFAESETRRRAAEALADVGGVLSRALDPDAVAQQIADSVRALFAAEGSALYRLDGDTGALEPLALAGRGGLAAEPGHVTPRAPGLIGLAVRERQPVSSPDLLHDARLARTPDARPGDESAPGGSGLAVPLLHKDAVIGALAVEDRLGRVFKPDEIRLAQAFGDQAALALENARLYEQTRQRLLQVDSVREVIEQILVPFSLEERLTLVARKAAALFDADRAVVALLDAGTLTIRAGHNLAEGELGMILPMDVGAVGLAALRGEGVLVNDYQAWPARRPHHPAALSSIIAFPLLIRAEVIGTLSVGFTRPGRRVTRADLERLATLAAPAALAIEHSRLYEQLETRLGELRDTQAQLVQAGKLSAVGQLVSGVAHELNNPLSVVIGYGQLLLRKEAPPTMTKALESIVAQAERMAKIVQSLLLFARQRKAERLPVQVGEILERTVALRATQLRLSGIAIDLERGAELPAVLGDGQQLQQVFLNLLLNAEQAILEHRTGDRIDVGARAAEGPGGTEVRAWVRDNGPGIPPDVLPRIFEPFFTTKEIGSGTGLGLSVSYGIVEQHGGHIDVESRPGVTIFTVVLPVTAERMAPPVATEAPPPAPVGAGRCALVVDDEVPVADMVATLLRETGWTVEVATSARGGLERIGQGRYDLVVSDIRMPDGDGESFYRTVVAAHPELARRFLIITGDTANASAWMFLAQTGLPAVEKPFAPAAFFRAVESVLVPP
jgi:signal transduction histidine kinase/CheY-like chemotaxis protein